MPRHDRKWYVLEQPLGEAQPANANATVRNAYRKHTDDLLDVGCLMLATMSPELQTGLMNTNAYDMIRQLRDMFQTMGTKAKDVLMVQDGGVKKKHGQGSTSRGKGQMQVSQSAPRFVENGKTKGKGKKFKANKARTENRCFRCHEVRHWRKNCPKRHETGKLGVIPVSSSSGNMVKYFIRVNDDLVGLVIPQRGLRQGDPLSPYLFILCVEGLSTFLYYEEAGGRLHGCRVARATSGQAINYAKSRIMCSNNIAPKLMHGFSNILGIDKPLNTGIYLGLPSLSDGSRSINWLSWDKICTPKKFGRLGFCDLTAFNVAMLGKQGWRLVSNPSSLVNRIFKAKYYPHGDFMEARLGNSPSFIWKSMWHSQLALREGLRWKVGDGKTIKIWDDPWLRDDKNFKVEMPMDPQRSNMMPSGNPVWSESGLWGKVDQHAREVDSFADLIFRMLRENPRHIGDQFVMILWTIWQRRNDII
ncbi:hypothetical protein OSB04_006579 [Centaurea solstitialis]|uniref:CCHC-type domain-containing protein n=1 Tax=Centaurea solstitialis TaxID=347529 RepID=A0AA38TI75_9ASTR|nr:hypothetical protein OSB04_006579 [Centaurea solstitialis]